MNRRLIVLGATLAVALLSGCATPHMVNSRVQSFGDWPAGRAPGKYAIERLPSQAQGTPLMQAVEDGAHQALQQAGFQPALDAASADVIVQVGARVTRYEPSPWADPLWWRWGHSYWRSPHGSLRYAPYAPYASPAWRLAPLPDREVALLLRDRSATTPLWEGRASSSGNATTAEAFSAMFSAVLADFPQSKPEAREVSVPRP